MNFTLKFDLTARNGNGLTMKNTIELCPLPAQNLSWGIDTVVSMLKQGGFASSTLNDCIVEALIPYIDSPPMGKNFKRVAVLNLSNMVMEIYLKVS